MIYRSQGKRQLLSYLSLGDPGVLLNASAYQSMTVHINSSVNFKMFKKVKIEKYMNIIPRPTCIARHKTRIVLESVQFLEKKAVL